MDTKGNLYPLNIFTEQTFPRVCDCPKIFWFDYQQAHYFFLKKYGHGGNRTPTKRVGAAYSTTILRTHIDNILTKKFFLNYFITNFNLFFR